MHVAFVSQVSLAPLHETLPQQLGDGDSEAVLRSFEEGSRNPPLGQMGFGPGVFGGPLKLHSPRKI